ncbi:kinesin-like protein KIF25 isoform X5 [Chlorocebus sabaeus]|uniref:kinesin-like protein KIF25 isoform X5 n=1 Tax=Chlorocebus sabaeus TaxID=60711 RepID=UPI003BF9E024
MPHCHQSVALVCDVLGVTGPAMKWLFHWDSRTGTQVEHCPPHALCRSGGCTGLLVLLALPALPASHPPGGGAPCLRLMLLLPVSPAPKVSPVSLALQVVTLFPSNSIPQHPPAQSGLPVPTQARSPVFLLPTVKSPKAQGSPTLSAGHPGAMDIPVIAVPHLVSPGGSGTVDFPRIAVPRPVSPGGSGTADFLGIAVPHLVSPRGFGTADFLGIAVPRPVSPGGFGTADFLGIAVPHLVSPRGFGTADFLGIAVPHLVSPRGFGTADFLGIAVPHLDVLPPRTWPGPSGSALGVPPRRLLWLRAPRTPGSPGVVPAVFSATYKGKIEKSRSEATRISTLYNKQQRLQRNTRSALSQLDRVIQKLNQDIQAFHSSSRALLRDYQDEYQDRVSAIVTAVQRTRQSTETLLACQAKVVHLEQALQDVSARHQQEKQRRKVLHNSLVELKGNIRVHCRIRPLLPFDSESDDPVLQSSSTSREVAHAVDDETVLVKCDRPGHPLINKTYHFERVYGPAESQSAVFGDVCPLLTSLLDGLISENPSRSPKVEVSIVEVYNNDIFDLLAKDTVAAVSGVKREVMTAKDGRTEVALLASEAVGSASKLMELVRGGLQLRAKHPTVVHADSSRSHLIITVTLTTAACSDSIADQACSATLPREQTEAGRAGRSRRTSQGASAPQPVPGDPAGRAEQVQARLQLVDLAGSECIGVSGVTGSALRETACINRSLAALADVLGALSEHRGHIPYRNSRLTHLLQDCLGNRFSQNPPGWGTTCPRTRAHTSSLHVLEGHQCTPCTSCALTVASWHSHGTLVILRRCLTSARLLTCSVCV